MISRTLDGVDFLIVPGHRRYNDSMIWYLDARVSEPTSLHQVADVVISAMSIIWPDVWGTVVCDVLRSQVVACFHYDDNGYHLAHLGAIDNEDIRKFQEYLNISDEELVIARLAKEMG